jgi:hypothetical protein
MANFINAMRKTVRGLAVLVAAVLVAGRADGGDPAPGGSKPTDVLQDQSGTCALLSTLAAMSHVGMSPEKHIKSREGNKYEVTMFDRNRKGVRIPVTYDGPDKLDPQVRNGKTWPVIIQRAYGTQWSLTDGDNAGIVAEMLTGHRALNWHPKDEPLAVTKKRIRAAVADKRPVTIGIDAGVSGIKYLVGGHQYTVLSADDKWLTVRNPWGNHGHEPHEQPDGKTGFADGVLKLRWETFEKWGNDATIAVHRGFGPDRNLAVRLTDVYRVKVPQGKTFAATFEFADGASEMAVQVSLVNAAIDGKKEFERGNYSRSAAEFRIDPSDFELELEIVGFAKAGRPDGGKPWFQTRHDGGDGRVTFLDKHGKDKNGAVVRIEIK